MPEFFSSINDIVSEEIALSDKVFSKDKWLEAAKEQVEKGYITEAELAFASDTWVADLAGKKHSDIDEIERSVLKEEWFV